ncbi:hypothetical protein ACFY0A_37260 [Streptomyces sp. NPDC001698]|uniref:hypothetical protein n=1 Tax=unclassified Streptomyces TaxID=2593676 RepID=UPI00369BB8C6
MPGAVQPARLASKSAWVAGVDQVRTQDARTCRTSAGSGKIAAARKLLTLVYYGLRDGHISALTRSLAEQPG